MIIDSPRGKGVRKVDKISDCIGQLSEVFVFGLVPHGPVMNQRTKPVGPKKEMLFTFYI